MVFDTIATMESYFADLQKIYMFNAGKIAVFPQFAFFICSQYLSERTSLSYVAIG